MKKMHRALSLVLSLIMLISLLTAFSVNSSAQVVPLGCVIQKDPKWKDDIYGTGSLYSTGCGIFSLVNAVGYLTGKRMDVKEVAAWAHSIGAYNPPGDSAGGTYRSALYPKVTEKFGKRYGFTLDCNGTSGWWANSYSSILINHLLNGGVAIGHVPGHFVAIVGFDSNSQKYHIYESYPSSSRGTQYAYDGNYYPTKAQFNKGGLKLDWFCLLSYTGDTEVTPNEDAFSPKGNDLYTKAVSVVDGWAGVGNAGQYFDWFSRIYPRSSLSATSCTPQQRYASAIVSYLWTGSSFPGQGDATYQTMQDVYSLPKLATVVQNGKTYYYFNSGNDAGTASRRNETGFLVNGSYIFFRQEALDDTCGNITPENVKRVIGGRAIPGSVLLVQKNGNYTDSVDIMILEKVTADGVYVSYQSTTASSGNYSNQLNANYTKVNIHKFISYADLAGIYSRHIEFLSYYTPSTVYNQADGYFVPAFYTLSSMAHDVYNITYGQTPSIDGFDVCSRFATLDDNTVSPYNMMATAGNEAVVSNITLKSSGKDSVSARIATTVTVSGCGSSKVTIYSTVNDCIQQFTVNVKPKIYAVGSIDAGSSANLRADSGNTPVVWTSSAPSVASVSGNMLTGNSSGTATITAEAGGQTSSFDVTVRGGAVTVPSSVTLNKTSITLNQGNTETLSATVNPSDAENKTVSWSSSDTAVAAVADGHVKAVGVGSAVITATTFNGKTATCSVTVNAAAPENPGFSPDGNNLYDKLISVIDGWARTDSNPDFYDRFSAVYPRSSATSTSCIAQLRYASGMLSYLWSGSTFPGYSDSVYKEVQNKYSLPKLGYANNGGKYYYFFDSGKGAGTAEQRQTLGFIVNGNYILFRMEVLEDALGNLDADNVKRIISGKAIPGSLLLVQRQGNYINSVDLMVVEKAVPSGVYVSYQCTTANETNYANQSVSGWAKVERHKYISYADLAAAYSRHIELLSYITPDIAYNIAPGYDVPAYFARQDLAQKTYTVNFGDNISTQSFPVATRLSSDDANRIKDGNMYAVSSDTSVVKDIVINGVSKDGTSAYVSVSARAVGCGTAEITLKSAVNDNIQTIVVNVKPTVSKINTVREFASAPLSASTGGKAVVWSSSKPSVARIDGDRIVGVSAGSAVITATAAGQKSSFDITVTEHEHIAVIDPAVPATCTSTGLTEGSHCSICNKVIVKQKVIPVKEHTAVIDPAVEPTYEATGLTEGSHCSVCGKVIVPQQIVPMLEGPAAPIKFKGAFLNLRSSITVNFFADAVVLDEYSDIYAEFTVNGSTIKVSDYNSDGNRIVFEYNRLKPSQLAEDIHAVIYGTFNGKVYKHEVDYGVHTYVTNMLKKTASDASEKSFRTLLVDLMNYGAASQLYTNYKTDVLATSFLTAEELKEGTQTAPVLNSILDTAFKVTDSPEVYFKGASLNLREAVKISFSIEAKDLTGLVAEIEAAGKIYEVPASAFVPDAQGKADRYSIIFDKLNAAAMRTPVNITILRNGIAVSNTLRYSIESYASSKAETGNSLSELVISMMKYGDSAEAFSG